MTYIQLGKGVSMRTPIFTGVCTALVTPFHENGKIDYKSLENLLDRQLASDVSAVCVCGTTGESATLTPQEHDVLVSFCVNYIKGRIKVIAGAGSNNTAQAIDMACRAEDLGADGLLMVTPYYNKATQEGLYAHYAAIAEQVQLPIILYNVPARTGVSFKPETYARLADLPSINGVKEASGDLSLVTHTKVSCHDDFFIWSGNDDQVVPMMSLGAKGVVSVASNIIPEVMVQMCKLCQSEDYDAAGALQIRYSRLIDALFCEVNPIPVKAAMELLGFCSAHTRLPLVGISKEHRALLGQELAALERI